MNAIDFSDDPQAVEAAQIQQRMKLAQLLSQQAMAPAPVYSGKAAAARALGGLLGGIESGMAAKDQMALAQRQSGERQAEMGRLLETAQGGDRAALARMLIQSRNPKLQMAGLSTALEKPKEEEAYTLSEGAVRLKGDRVIAANPKAEKPEGPKLGALRERIKDDRMVQEEWDGKQWVAIGEGGRWNPKAGTTVNVNGPKEIFKNEKTLRDEFTDASKPFVKIRDAYSQVKDALSGDITAPATLAGATKFMKMLDPDSVVRESELNMALKSSGMMDRFMNLHNTVAKGQVLTPAQAKEIQRIAGVLYGTAESQQKKVGAYYTKLASDYELDPARIVRDLAPTGAAGGGSPASIQNDAEFAALPSGAIFVGPDGKTRRKP